MQSKKMLESFIEKQNYSSVFTSQKVAIKSLLKDQESPAFFLPLSHPTGTSSPFSIPFFIILTAESTCLQTASLSNSESFGSVCIILSVFREKGPPSRST